MHTAYPVHLGIAYIFLVGYLVRTLFVSLRLPASIGVLISGIVFSHFFQDDLQNARASLQEIAFFTILLEAGLDLTLQDLQPYIFVLAWLPWACEVAAVTAYGMFALDFSKKEALVLGTILSTLGPGLVMPKMKEFATVCKRHPLPRLVFTWAPLEGSMALIFFGFMLGLVAPNQPFIASQYISTLILANMLRVVATVGMGCVVGSVSGWLISRRMRLRVKGRPIFIGLPVETFLMTLAAALFAFGLGASHHGRIFIPWPFGIAPGSLFQSEPLVVAMGTTFSIVVDRHTLQDVESILGGLWVFGQLVLFTMIGCGTDLSILGEMRSVLPVMGLGLAVRLVGVFIAVFGTRKARGCEMQSYWSTTKDATFCFLATIPRATLQAALGAVPLSARFFHEDPGRKAVGQFIFTAAKVYIICMSIVGQTLLNWFGPILLESTMERPEEEYCKGCPVVGQVNKEEVGAASASTMATASVPVSERENSFAPSVMGVVRQLAAENGVNATILKHLLQEESRGRKEDDPDAMPPLPHAEESHRALRKIKNISNGDLVLNQFDSTGYVYNFGARSSWRPSRLRKLMRSKSGEH